MSVFTSDFLTIQEKRCTWRKEEKLLDILTQGIFLRFSNYRIPLRICCPITKVRSPLCSDVRIIKEIKDCGHKISAESRDRLARGRELLPSWLARTDARGDGTDIRLTTGRTLSRRVGRGRTNARIIWPRVCAPARILMSVLAAPIVSRLL